MEDKRRVRFNIAHAGYRPGQIVNYAEMPEGHRAWVDHKSILQSDRICEFIEDTRVLDLLQTPEPEKEPDVDTDASPESEAEQKPDTDTDEIENGLSFDFEPDSKLFCPGKNKDGSPCKRDKLRANGYCFQHQDQAPASLDEY